MSSTRWRDKARPCTASAVKRVKSRFLFKEKNSSLFSLVEKETNKTNKTNKMKILIFTIINVHKISSLSTHTRATVYNAQLIFINNISTRKTIYIICSNQIYDDFEEGFALPPVALARPPPLLFPRHNKRIGVPSNPIFFLSCLSMNLLYVSENSFGSLQKNTNVGGRIAACVV